MAGPSGHRVITFANVRDHLRALRGVAQTIGDVRLTQGLLDLQGQLLHLQVHVLEQQVESRIMQDEVARLRGCLAIARRLQRVNGAYFVVQSDADVRGPYCVPCWDRREILHALIDSEDGTGYCPNCNAKTGEADRPQRRIADCNQMAEEMTPVERHVA